MATSNRNSVLWIDVLGTLTTVSLAALAAWLTFFAGTGPRGEIAVLREKITGAERRMAGLRVELTAERDLVAARSKELEATGQLPQDPVIEEDLQALADLAQRNSVSVLRVAPLTRKEYPGLLEIRYAVDAAGTLPDITRFLRSIELAPFWADVSHMKIESQALPNGEGTPRRLAQLTLSLFASPEKAKDEKDSGA
jgi:hypothetical protein